MNALLPLYQALVYSKVPEDQAKKAVDAIENKMVNELATKLDLHALGTEIRLEIAALRTELKMEIEALRTEMRSEMRAVELRMTIKLGAMIFLAAGLVISALKLS